MNIVAKIVLGLSVLFSVNSYAANHVVELLTADKSGQTMVMSPGYIKIAPGDSITFKPSDATHNVESMISPKGAEKFASEMGKEVTITFTKEGAYLYKCTPHFALGMLGVVQVGAAVNLEQLKAEWAKVNAGVVMNKERVTGYISQIK